VITELIQLNTRPRDYIIKFVSIILAVFTSLSSLGMPRHIQFPGGTKIAFLDIDLRKTKMALGVQVVITDPAKLEAIRKREGDITKERIQRMVDAGANVVLTTKGIDDMAMKVFVENKMIAVRRVPKKDLKKIANITGGQMIMSMADDDAGETFDPSYLGVCESVGEEKVGDGELLYFRGCTNTRAQTIVLHREDSSRLRRA